MVPIDWPEPFGLVMLIVGVDKVVGEGDHFHRAVEEVTIRFKGPVALVDSKVRPLSQPPKILVPVSGSTVSRRGAEIAVALTRATSGTLRAIYVATTRDKGVRRGRSLALPQQEAALKETSTLAARLGVDITTALRAGPTPETAILQEIRSGTSIS